MKFVVIVGAVTIVAAGLAVFLYIGSDGAAVSSAPSIDEHARVGRGRSSGTPGAPFPNTTLPTPRRIVEALPKPYSPIVTYYQELLGAAHAGDARAACRLAVDLSDCAANSRAIHAIEQVTQQAGTIGDEGMASRMSSALDQVERSAQMCEGVNEKMLASAFDLQRLAVHLDPKRFGAWLAANPSLDRSAFLSHMAEWDEYRQFAEAFTASSMEERRLEHLPVLLMIFAPDSVEGLRPPYRQADPAVFLSLYEAAKANEVPIPPDVSAQAQMMLGEGKVRPATGLGVGWTGRAAKSLGEVYLELYPKPLVTDYCE